VDLTDRLLDSDKLPNLVVGTAPTVDKGGLSAAAAGGENSGEVLEGTFVTPLAVSPPAIKVGVDGGQAIRDVQEFLAQVTDRLDSLQQTDLELRSQAIAGLPPANAGDLGRTLHFSLAANRVHAIDCTGGIEQLMHRVYELVTMCKAEGRR